MSRDDPDHVSPVRNVERDRCKFLGRPLSFQLVNFVSIGYESRDLGFEYIFIRTHRAPLRVNIHASTNDIAWSVGQAP